MSPPLTFNPPISIDLCETAGREFGHARIVMERTVFEQELEAQLVALDDALRAADIDRDQAWQCSIRQPGAPGRPQKVRQRRNTFQEQSRPLGP
jgi:hypothetical protein